MTASQVAKETFPSVVLLLMEDENRQPLSLGSGFFISQNIIATNFHVIEKTEIDNIKIECDGKFYRPVRLYHDRETDLSVMAIESRDLIPARFGNSDDVEIGDFVIAVGSPFGLSHSVSYGIVSALERHDLDLGPQGVRYQDFIQTDAAINPGNSGGPLISLDGEIVGINTAIASNGGGSDGIGFAIPSNMVARIVFDLIDHGEVRRGFLGVSLDARFNAERAKALGLDLNYGALVSSVTEDSPADQAGIRTGDVVVEFDGQRIADDSQLVTRVSVKPIGSSVPLRVYRGGKFIDLMVTIRNRREFDWR